MGYRKGGRLKCFYSEGITQITFTKYDKFNPKCIGKELQTFRNYFTDSQWDVIDMALSEFQDHDEYVEILDTIGLKLQTLFDKTECQD